MALVSVVMAVHNGASHLAEAMQSILTQDGVDADFVVVDDGSTDATADILNAIVDSRLTILANGRNLGLTASLNRGLATATGRFIARMDADDVSLPGRLNAQAKILDRAQICFGRTVIEREGETRVWKEHPWPLMLWRGLFENAYGAHPAVMARRDAIDAAGGYDEAFAQAQDYDLWDRCVARGYRFAYTQAPVLRYRSHPAAVTRTHGEQQAEFARRVSDRALRRTFADMGDDERRGLRWLMSGLGRPDTTAIETAMTRCAERVDTFTRRYGGRRPIWLDVSSSVTRRLAGLDAGLIAPAAALLRRAAACSLSPRATVRAWRAKRMAVAGNRP